MTAAGALDGLRVCDFTGQLAGAGATRWLAAFGAEVIRIEDPAREGRWDILRGAPPFVDERRGIDMGGAFNNHNAGKLGVTVDLRKREGKEIARRLVAVSDVVAENFAKGVMERLGFGYQRLKAIKPDIVYVSNCGFGHTGPYGSFKTWGPIVQAVSGLTFTNGLPGREPAGWGYSYMDHTGAYFMAIAILLALLHRRRTGEGQWVDVACAEAALTLHGPALLDWTLNGRPSRRPGAPHANRAEWPPMAPHGIYRCRGDDEWVALAVRHDDDWRALGAVVQADWCDAAEYASAPGRCARQQRLDEQLGGWLAERSKFEVEAALRDAGVPAAAVLKPAERIDSDASTGNFGLWPEVRHAKMGRVRVDGQPARLRKTPWRFDRAGPCLGEHNDEVLTGLLGYSTAEVAALRDGGVI